MQTLNIWGWDSGLQKNTKPFFIKDDAFQNLENAYVYRKEVRKREGAKVAGRLRRVLINVTNNQSGAPMTFTIPGAGSGTISLLLTLYGPTGSETAPQVEIGYTGSSNIITFDPGGVNETIFTDTLGTGILTVTGAVGKFTSNAWINYATGVITANFNGVGAGNVVNVTFTQLKYYPFLPVMGITTRDTTDINQEQTIFFDTKYAYIYTAGGFEEFIPGTTWNGTDSDFFWTANYRGSDTQTRLFFETNFVNDAGSPMRYTDATTWTTFQPQINAAGTQFIFTSRLIVPYYGRLLCLNTIEGVDRGTAINYYNRVRFSQLGNPVAADAFHSDVFGKGGFIDAPINEEIISAQFYKNVLIVFFERSTWRLQYVGEYGLPFVWERISSDFGSESTFSTVLFDSGVLAIGDKAIVTSSGSDVARIDLDIPDTVFDIQNVEKGPNRVQSGRQFQKEVVYWSYVKAYEGSIYPNRILLYNYRNNTYANFRITVTAIGSFPLTEGITWDRTDIYWDNETVLWDSFLQTFTPAIGLGNQHGFIHVLGYDAQGTAALSNIDANDQESLSVTNVVVTDVVTLTVPNHNLEDEEWIYLSGLKYVINTSPYIAGSTNLNDKIYQIKIDPTDPVNKFILSRWDLGTQEADFNFGVGNTGDYAGHGLVALLSNIVIQTKDFFPLKQQGQYIKTSSLGFLMDSTPNLNIGVNMIMNTNVNAQGNISAGNKDIETTNTKTGLVLAATQSNPCIINSPDHCLLDGDTVIFNNMEGLTELNGNEYVITLVTTDTFSIPVDSSAFGVYLGEGNWVQTNQEYFTLSGQYVWHQFYANCYGQFLSIEMKYNNDQMSQLFTHQQDFVVNALQLNFLPGGRNIFGK